MLNQYRCQIYDHNDELIIGMCQNVQCKQYSRLVCEYCVELHRQDENFIQKDIVSQEDLDVKLKHFKQNKSERQRETLKECRINKYKLLIEIQEFIQFWQVKYKKWDSVEQILLSNTDEYQKFTLSTYINDQHNKLNLSQYLTRLDQKCQYQINLKLSQQHIYDFKQKLNKFKSQTIDSLNDNLIKWDIKIDDEQIKTFERRENFYIFDDGDLELKELQDLEIKQQDDYFEQQICRKGWILYKEGKFQKALDYFDKLITLFPENCLAYSIKANIFKDQKDHKKGIQCLNNCIEFNPKNTNAYQQKAFLLFYLSKYEEANNCWIQCIEANPYYIYAYEKREQILRELQKYQDIDRCREQCVQNNPYNFEAFEKIALKLLREQKYKEAITYWDLCIQSNPTYADRAKDLQAQILKDQVDTKQFFNQGIQANPNHEVNDFNRKTIKLLEDCIYYNKNHSSADLQAQILKDQKMQVDSNQFLNQGIQANPNHEDADYQKAQTFIIQNKLDEARKYLEHYTTIQDNLSAYDLQHILAQLLKDKKKFNEAINCWDQFIQANPTSDAYYSKANILKELKQYAPAISCWDQCIAAIPSFTDAYGYKQQILKLILKENSKEAIKCLDQCIKDNKNYEEAYQEKAKILMKQNNYGDAIICMDQCLEANPQSQEAHKFRGQIVQYNSQNIKEVSSLVALQSGQQQE